MGGTFNPRPHAEYHVTETTCQKAGNQWGKKGMWDCTLSSTTFQRGPQRASKSLWRGPLIRTTCLGYP